MRRVLPPIPCVRGAVIVLGLLLLSSCLSREATLEIREGDHISIIGNTLAERMQYFGYFETLLHARFPDTSSSSGTSVTPPTRLPSGLDP